MTVIPIALGELRLIPEDLVRGMEELEIKDHMETI